jgi:hypothetical protein
VNVGREERIRVGDRGSEDHFAAMRYDKIIYRQRRI